MQPYPPPIKLSKDMVDAMGGANSDDLKKFRSHCYNAFLILRKHSNLILNLFVLMLSSSVGDIALEPDKTVRFCRLFYLCLLRHLLLGPKGPGEVSLGLERRASHSILPGGTQRWMLLYIPRNDVAVVGYGWECESAVPSVCGEGASVGPILAQITLAFSLN